MAQLGSALSWGGRGREFESLHTDQLILLTSISYKLKHPLYRTIKLAFLNIYRTLFNLIYFLLSDSDWGGYIGRELMAPS